MKVTYEMSITELKAIINLILKGIKEDDAFERILGKHFGVKP